MFAKFRVDDFLLGIIIYITLSFCSVFFAPNVSLIWPELIGWILLAIFYFIISSLEFSSRLIDRASIFIGSFFAFNILTFYLFYFMVGRYETFNIIKELGFNLNLYPASLLLSSIFFNHTPIISNRIMRVFVAAALVPLLFIFQVKGLIIGFIFILLIELNFKLNLNRLLILLIVAFLFIFLQVGVDDSRLFLIKHGLLYSKSNLLLGIGTGNWYSVFSTTLDGNSNYTNPNFFTRAQSHNLFIKILVEQGIIGLTSFCILLYTIFLKFNKLEILRDKQLALSSLVLFLTICLFYNFHITQLNYFSSFQFALIALTSFFCKK